MLKFLFSKTFLKQLVISILLAFAVIVSVYFFLKSYARTGEAIMVPDLNGFDIIEAEALLKQSSLQGVIIDSLFIDGKRGGEIVDQEPRATSLVKTDRKIYLTITRYSTPSTKLPNVINQGLPLAQAKLTSYGFKIGKLIPKADPCTDCAIGIQVNGKRIEPGANLPKNTKLDIVFGQREDGAKVTVPVLYGLSREEAKNMLFAHNLNLGALVNEAQTKSDSLASKVYMQSANPGDEISMGSSVNVYLSPDLTKVPGVHLDSLKSLVK